MVFRGCWGRISRQLSYLLWLLASAICEKGGWKQPSVLQEMKWPQHHSSGTWMQYQLHRPERWEHVPALARQGQTGGWSRECCLSPAHLPGHQPGSLASGGQPKPPAWERYQASAGIKLHHAHRWWACLHSPLCGICRYCKASCTACLLTFLFSALGFSALYSFPGPSGFDPSGFDPWICFAGELFSLTYSGNS